MNRNKRYGLSSRPSLVWWLAVEMRAGGKPEVSERSVEFLLYRMARWMIQASRDRAVPFWGRVACSVTARILEKEIDRHV